MIIVDNFAPLGLIRSAQATWLPESSGLWHRYENGKLATKGPHLLPIAVQKLIDRMAEIDIGGLLGIPEAFPDIEYLHGAGMHQTSPGGKLGIHLDSERHPTLPWKRMASAVIYIDNCDGGEFETCDEFGNVNQTVNITENRMVLFATDKQWHRVCETRSRRRSVCLFFWSQDETATGNDRALFR